MSSRPLGANYRRLWSASVVSNLGDGVSVIAYPWLASALTRNPVAIAGVLLATRLPWLVFTLPAGVITDRVDRRRLVASMDAVRAVLTTAVAAAVLWGHDRLADPQALTEGAVPAPDQAWMGLMLLYVAALLLGAAEVLRDNAAQTVLPSIVDEEDLERANGRLWGAELLMNSFVGPPLAGFLLAVAFWLPFVVDAGTFFVAAALVASMQGTFSARPVAGEPAPTGRGWRAEMAEGFGYLWRHRLLRSLAISLAVLNGVGAMTQAVLVLFAQEVLDLGPAGFGLLSIAGAVGGVVGALFGPWVSERVGRGPSLFATIAVSSLGSLAIAAVPLVAVVAVAFAAMAFVGTVWNVITVALRQSIIPDPLLGRVNSVYRFFGWGSIPVGSLVGGLVVAGADQLTDRETALIVPFVLSAVMFAALLVYALPRLNSAEIDAARR